MTKRNAACTVWFEYLVFEFVSDFEIRISRNRAMDRSNPYEAAFEAYLKANGLCYVCVDETRRACLGDTSVKNLDFIVLGLTGARLLVDVKGRQFPGGSADKPRYTWESWSTQEDIDGLGNWMKLFGPDYLALFVFMYKIQPTIALDADTPDQFDFRGDKYLLRAVTLDEYCQHVRTRSPKWGTVGLPGAMFRKLVRPFRYYTHECPCATGEALVDGEAQARRLTEVTALAFASFAAGGASGRRPGR
jgi:hypothetical protein